MLPIELPRNSIVFHSCLILALATPGCMVAPSGGGGGGGGGPEVCDGRVSAPLAGSDSWNITSGESATGDFMLVSGFGDTVEGVLLANGDFLSGDENAQLCLSLAPAADATLDFDGTNLTLSVSFADDISGETCTVDLTGTVEECGTRDFFGNDYNLGYTFDLQAQGTAVYPGGEIDISGLDLLLLRPDACTPAPLVEQVWTLSNVNPDFQQLSFFSDAVTINLGGVGTTAESAIVYTAGPDFRVLCTDETPAVTLSFDGTTLSVSAEFEGTADDGSPDGTTCSLEFTGTAAACELFGITAQDQIVPLEGTGSYTTPELSGDLPTLYLSTSSVAGL